jgi:hypothetical protein
MTATAYLKNKARMWFTAELNGTFNICLFALLRSQLFLNDALYHIFAVAKISILA